MDYVERRGHTRKANPLPVEDGEIPLTVNTIRLEVPGLPPAKNTAKSLLSSRHQHRGRVEALLLSAREEMERLRFAGFGRSRLRLEVEVHAVSDLEPWDATNYLGGIADVLEAKARRLANPQGLSLDHLNDLAQIGLYEDDRQIKEVFYREVPSTVSLYIVKLSSLEA